jgi:HK97 family phage prohead protease
VYLKAAPTIALKRLAKADQGVIEGLAATYGAVDRQGDTLLAGAFADSIEAFAAGELVLPLLLDHCMPIGSVTSLSDSAAGLSVTAQLALGTDEAARVFELAKAGAVPLSVAFTLDDDDFTLGPAGGRVIATADLFEISVVATAANAQAGTTGVKSFAHPLGDWRETERLLRTQHSLSARAARRFVAVGRKALGDGAQDDQLDVVDAILAAARYISTLEKSS